MERTMNVQAAEYPTEVPAHGIKGALFFQVVDEVRRLIASGRVNRAAVDRWLTAEDLRRLAARVIPSEWYPIEAYLRMARLLLAEAGNGSTEYLRESGRRSARLLVGTDRFEAVAYTARAELGRAVTEEERFEAFGSHLRRFVALARTVLNFSRWTPLLDPDHPHRYLIEVSEATAIPDEMCWRIDGFLNELASTHGRGGLWTWERVAPDTIQFRMTREA
jgi:hypothetical protein